MCYEKNPKKSAILGKIILKQIRGLQNSLLNNVTVSTKLYITQHTINLVHIFIFCCLFYEFVKQIQNKNFCTF